MNKKVFKSFNEFKSLIITDFSSYMKDVEEYIKKPVIMLNQLPFVTTTCSCQGHPSSPHRKHYVMPFIWGMVKNESIFKFIELVEKAEVHWFIHTPKLFVHTQSYFLSKIQDGAFFRLQIPADVGVEKGRRRFAKLAKIIEEKI